MPRPRATISNLKSLIKNYAAGRSLGACAACAKPAPVTARTLRRALVEAGQTIR
jgi:hypothetical protein